MRAAAFSVPPQQLISCDGGIVEIGAEIQYGICDLVTMNNEIMDIYFLITHLKVKISKYT